MGFAQKFLLKQISEVQVRSVKPQEHKVWLSRSRGPEAVAKQYSEELFNEVRYADTSFANTPWVPGLQSYYILHSLSKKTKLKINIPDTFIFGYGFENPTYIYTDEQG